MAWIVEDQEPEQGNASENGVWKVEDQEEPKTSYGRAIGSALAGIGTGAMDMAAHLFGGAPGGIMAQQAERERQQPGAMYDLQKLLKQASGLSEEEAIEQLGERPKEKETMDLRGLIDELTGGRFIPQTGPERIATRAGETAGEFLTLGELLPIGQAAGAMLPESVASRLGLGAESAGAEKGMEGLLKELKFGARFGAGEQVGEEAGFGPLGQFISGLAAGASPWAWTKGKNAVSRAIEYGKDIIGVEGKEVASKVPKFMAESGTPKALADIELSQKDLVGRTAQISEDMLGELESNVGKVGEASMKDVGTFRAADIENQLVEANQKALLDTISPIDASKKDSWSGIIDVVNENFDAAKKSYNSVYDMAEEVASKIKYAPQELMNAAKKLKKEMKGSLVSVAEEGSVKGAAESLVKRLIPEQGKLAETLVKDLAEEGIIADFEEVLRMMNKLAEKEGVARPVSVDQIMKTKRSLNRILSKSDIIPAPVDLLRPLSKAAKSDVRAGLASDKSALEAFDAAEDIFSKTQKVFNVPEMVRARKSANPETLSSYFEKPSNLERLKKALGSEEAVKDLADKMIVDSIAKKNIDAAREMAKDSREFIGKKGKDALDKILEYGDKLTNPGQQSIARSNLLADVQKAASTGSRPSYALDLMKTDTGRKIVNSTLGRSPKGRKMLESLRKMSIDDLMESVVKDGRIDFEKAKDIISNPEIKNMVKDAVGDRGVKFFQRMETYGKNMGENLRQLSLKEPGMLESMFDKFLSNNAKIALYTLIPFTKGISVAPILAKEGISRSKKIKLFKILESTNSQKAVEGLGRKGLSAAETKTALKRFAQVIGSELKGED